jgi:hypothetical protein
MTLNGRLSSCSSLKTLKITTCIYRLQQLNPAHFENEEGVSISLRNVNTHVQVESDHDVDTYRRVDVRVL